MSIQTNLVPSDRQRIIRYIDTVPVYVSIENSESITHDVERYCAFRQDAFHESESLNDPSVAFLQQARDSKLKLLESLDKAINVIHLLTNTNWGEGVPPARFMSCRQSAPARERLSAVGDRSSAQQLESDIAYSRAQIEDDGRRYSRAKSLVRWMNESKVSVEMRVINGRIVPMLDLLPSASCEIARAVSGIALDSGEPKLELNALMRAFIQGGMALTVLIDSPVPDITISPSKDLTIEEEIFHAQRCALDIAVVRKLQDEPSERTSGGFRFLKNGVSKHFSNFSASFTLIHQDTMRPYNLTVMLAPQSVNQGLSICQTLRARVLQECSSGLANDAPLSSTLFQEVSELVSGRK